MAQVIALDIGTTKIVALVWDCQSGTIVDIASAANSATVDGLASEFHEQDVECIFQICCDLLSQLAAGGKISPDAVSGIAFSGQMHGVLLVDKDLQPLTNLMTWCDQRAAVLVASLDRATWPVERTGCYLHSGYGAASLAVLAAENKIPAGARALTIADFVAARLCGVVATGASHAASWGIMNLQEQCWDSELVDSLGIPAEILPEIKPEMSELACLKVDVGLPEDVIVHLPLGDNQASFFGTCGFANNTMLFNLGTGGQISYPLTEFASEGDLETRPLPFAGYLLVGASLCGGRSYALLKDFFRSALQDFTGSDLSDGDLYRVMDRLAVESDVELSVDTRFAGTRLDTTSSGAVAGIKVDNFTPGALCRGFTRGMIKELTGMVNTEVINQFDRIMVSGNGVRRNPLAMEFITEELGLPCVASESREEAAVGAAMALAKVKGLL